MAIKIAFLMRDFRRGGGEKSTLSLMNHLARSDFDIAVIVLNDVGPLKEELASEVRQYALRTSQGNAILFLPRLKVVGQRLRVLFEQFHPDIVVGTSWFLNLSAASIACEIHSMGARLVVINHNPVRDLAFRSSWFSVLAPVKRFITGQFFAKADRIVAITDVMRDDLKEVLHLPENKLVVIRNGISCSLTQSKSDEVVHMPALSSPYLVYVGRLEYEKGVDLLIDAFAIAAHRMPHTLLVIGDGGHRASLEQQVRRANLSERVVFAGGSSNPYPAMKRADFLVVPSRWDAFPYVILEALALELPIIATDCEGPVKILDNGDYGVIVKKGNVSQLAAAMVRIAGDAGLKASLRMKSVFRAMEFSSGKMLEQYETLFRNLGA